jgi:hypothetical protein
LLTLSQTIQLTSAPLLSLPYQTSRWVLPIPVNKLHIHIQHKQFYSNHLLQQVFSLLRPTLSLLTLHVHFVIDPGSVLHGQHMVYRPFENTQYLEDWALSAALTDRLERVVLEMRNIGWLARERHFLGLFGGANRPEVLRLVPEDIVFVD